MSDTVNENPPVTEIAFSVQFPKLGTVDVLDAYSFVEKFKSRFPIFQQAGRLATLPVPQVLPSVGATGPFQMQLQANIEMMDAVALPRLMLISSDSKQLLQFQDNRFGLNWRRIVPISEPSHYPGFDFLYEVFIELFSEFSEWAEERFGSRPAVQVGELTYINNISLKHEQGMHRLSHVFKFFTPDRLAPIAGFNASWLESIGAPTPGHLAMNTATGMTPDGTPIAVSSYVARANLQEVKGQPDQWFLPSHRKVLEVFGATIKFPVGVN